LQKTIVFQFQQFEAFSNLQLLLVFGQCHRHFSEARAWHILRTPDLLDTTSSRSVPWRSSTVTMAGSAHLSGRYWLLSTRPEPPTPTCCGYIVSGC